MNSKGYNCKNTKDCEECIKLYNMPYSYCCLDECGEHEFCRNCNHGIYENDSEEMKNKRKEENMTRGVKVTYEIDRDYFEVGAAYQIKIGFEYVIAICSFISDELVRFIYIKENIITEYTLLLNNLCHNPHDIVKMTPDYKKGKFINLTNC